LGRCLLRWPTDAVKFGQKVDARQRQKRTAHTRNSDTTADASSMPNLKLFVQILRDRLTTFGGWLTLIIGLTILLLAIPLTVLGLQLITLGGSWYYAIAGAVFAAAATLIVCEHRLVKAKQRRTYYRAGVQILVWQPTDGFTARSFVTK
jgi:hypothetical protein